MVNEMKVIFAVDGVNYLSQTKREARQFINYWYKEAITFDYPRPFRTTWRFRHIERAPSYGQINRLNLSQVEYGREKAKSWLTEKEADKLLNEVRER